jgi:hypothetical protein
VATVADLLRLGAWVLYGPAEAVLSTRWGPLALPVAALSAVAAGAGLGAVSARAAGGVRAGLVVAVLLAALLQPAVRTTQTTPKGGTR